jgi:hypothetical protein
MKARLLRNPVFYSLIGACLFLGRAYADTDSMHCENSQPETHANLAQGDQSTANHLQLSRKIAARAAIYLDVCNADVTITHSNGDTLRLTIDTASTSLPLKPAEYLQKLDLTPQEVRLQLHLKSKKAKVVLEIPTGTPTLQVNLATGNLSLDADRNADDTQINVGYGQINLNGDDNTYESLQVNVGLGSLHDHRRNGDNYHLIVSRSFSGKGKGSIQVNVGMGSVDLNPGGNNPI